ATTGPAVTGTAVSIPRRLDVRGYGKVEIKDQLFSNEGMSPRLLGSSRGVRALSELMSNPFEPAIVDRLDIDVQVEFRRDLAEIVSVALPGDAVRAGDTVPLRVTLKPYAGPEYVETVPVRVPATLAGQTVKVDVAAG